MKSGLLHKQGQSRAPGRPVQTGARNNDVVLRHNPSIIDLALNAIFRTISWNWVQYNVHDQSHCRVELPTSSPCSMYSYTIFNLAAVLEF